MLKTMLTPDRIVSALLAAVAIGGLLPRAATAAPPMPSAAEADYEASGFVAPAGMPMPGQHGSVMPAMFQPPQGPPGMMGMPGGVMPVGHFGGGPMDDGCDSCNGFGCNRCSDGRVGSGGMHGALGGGGACGGCGGACGGRCGLLGGGGLMGGGLMGGHCGGCGLLGGCGCGIGHGRLLGGLSRLCLFCGGGGCEACHMLGGGRLLGLFSCLLPYSEGGLCAQRWYDVSAEVLYLSRDGIGSNETLTTLGIGGPAVLTLADAGAGDSEAGMRLSGSILFGAGGNIELTYMGLNEWEGDARVESAAGDLFSFISNFGTAPPGGFPQTDSSVAQSVVVSGAFHSGEVNYRRRTVGPSCRFQGSWLGGLRYLRIDDSLTYSTLGTPGPGGQSFLNLDTSTENDLFGVQAGGDVWWNIVPGVSVGVELKGGILENDADRRIAAVADSLAPGTEATVGASETTTMGEFTLATVYRISHSWTLRGSYFVLRVDEVAGGFDAAVVNDLLDPAVTNEALLPLDSLTLDGFTFGAEYMW